MAFFSATCVLLLYFNLISGYVLMGEDENEIVWPTEYHMQGERINFITTLKEPFEFWYSADHNRSRIDLYGGTSKKFYYGDEGEIYSFFPVAGDEFATEIVCMEAYAEDALEDFMPDVSSLTYTGQTMTLFDKIVDIWTGTDDYLPGLVKEQTLYVYKTDAGYDIPVQQVVKIYNVERGEVKGHNILNYYNFRDSVDEDDLAVDDDLCGYKGQLGQDFKKDIEMLHPDIAWDVDMAFESYANHHSKQYHEKETQMRKEIFVNNWRMVHEHNRKNAGYKLTVNEYADRTDEELQYLTGTFVSKEQKSEALTFPHTLEEIDELAEDLPENFDLRVEGAVSAVKNQGNCGSCWAFATTAAVEGAVARVTGDRLLDLSEQSLVDCAWQYTNMGCHGGTLDGALKYVLDNGIPTEREYGVYIEHDGYCDILNMTKTYNIKGFTLVTPRNPKALKVALYKYGPVTVAIHASRKMKFYSNGIFYDFECEGSYPNHGVTVIGYGVRDGEDYWLVKNSWGEGWGEDGYILMSARNDNCFVLDTAYYPIV